VLAFLRSPPTGGAENRLRQSLRQNRIFIPFWEPGNSRRLDFRAAAGAQGDSESDGEREGGGEGAEGADVDLRDEEGERLSVMATTGWSDARAASTKAMVSAL
jgi:hypothetical protein